MLLVVLVLSGKAGKGTASIGEAFVENAAGACADRVLDTFLPVFSYAEQGQDGFGQLLEDTQMRQLLPLYSYLGGRQGQETQVEDRLTIDMILQAEGSDEGSGGGSPEPVTGGDAEAGTEGAPESEGASLEELLQAENAAAGGLAGQENALTQPEAAAESELLEPGGFIPHTRQARLDMESLKSYENLVKTLYTVDSTTMIGSDQLNIEALGGKDMTVFKDSPGPQILIYHTHSQEAFADSTPGDPSTGIVGVGDYLTRLLQERYGYQVLHHTGQYDVETRDDAYSRSLPAIEQVLADNPSIQVVIDLHRDAMAEGTHLVMDLDGRPTAKFMFFNGLSRTKKTGNISYLYNENLEDNLAFSYQMQVKAAEYYPGLTRKIYLKGYRYNMHLRPKTLLIELGAQNNTLQEALNACDPLAHILDMVLSGSG